MIKFKKITNIKCYNPNYKCYNTNAITIVFSILENFLSPECICDSESESTLHFFLHCHYYIPIRKILFEEVKAIDANLLKLPDCKLTGILLYGCSHFDEN